MQASNNIMDFAHKEAALKHLTGVRDGSLEDIILGYTNDFKVALKVSFKKHNNYYVTGYKNKTVIKGTDLIQEFINKGRKVRYVSGEYDVEFEWECAASDGYVWHWDDRKINMKDQDMELIKQKLNWLNNKNKTEERVY